MEATARALNSRARKAHLNAKIAERFTKSEDRASEKDEMLAPLPLEPRRRDKRVLDALGKKFAPPPSAQAAMMWARLSTESFR